MPQKVSKFIYNKRVYIIILITLLVVSIAVGVVIYNITKGKKEASPKPSTSQTKY
jgi:competence protein ComGC